MKPFEYTYIENDVYHVIQAKISQNSKIGIGYIVQTYHFSIDQVKNLDLKQDEKNCLDCPLSYSNGGGCYTHKGMQLMGLKSMLKRLNKNEFKPFNNDMLKAFIVNVSNTYPVDLVRFGAYGEAVLMGSPVINQLAKLGKTTGYTHQYNKSGFNWSNKRFMASVHNEEQAKQAKKLGFRSFIVKTKEIEIENGVNCPASKESEKNLSCIKCGLCSGMAKGSKKDIYINAH